MKPNRILLATDLTVRCDRALDRAVLLASQWDAELKVLHVLVAPQPVADEPSWHNSPDRAATARRQILSDLRETGKVRLEVIVERGQPAPKVLEAAESRGAELIVAGVPREETIARALLGSTLGTVARKAKAPLLVAKTRPRGPYRHVVVATDFSAASRSALETAIELVPDAEITVFHCFRVQFESFADDKMAVRAATAARAMEEARAFGASMPAAASRPAMPVLCEHGDIVRVLTALAHEKETDLVVLGAKGHSRVADLLLGSTAQRLVAELPIDVLLARPRPS